MHLFMIQLMVAVNLNNGWDTFDKVEYLDINQGQITSPGYPGKYTNNVKHAWEIRTRPNLTYFIFTIHDMDIPCGDYLKIEEVNPCCHTPFYKCGKMHEQKRTVYVRGKQIRISFTSDNTLNARGFNLSWTASTTIPSTTTRRTYLSKKTTKLKTNLANKTTSTSTELTTTSTIYTTIEPSTKLTITPSLSIALTPSLTSSIIPMKSTYTRVKTKPTLLTTHLSATAKSKTSMFTGYMIIGICIFEALLIVIGVIIVKRYRSRASKEHVPVKEATGTDSLVTPSTEKGADIAYESMPLEFDLPSNVNKNEEVVYVEHPDNVYDSTLIRRPHVLQQNNIYQTNEGIYHATCTKRDHNINNDSNPYQSCD